MIIKAYQIADGIDLKQFKSNYEGKLHSYSTSDAYYTNENERYLYVLSYGVVVFCGYDELKISEHIEFIMSYCNNPLKEKLSEDFIIQKTNEKDKFEHNEAHLSIINDDVIKIILLNIGQSVALDYFLSQAIQMLDETNNYTKMLEKKGRLMITNQTLLKFIGKTLIVKNNIVEQLYVFEQPEAAWNDEYLSKVDNGLSQIFDIKNRFRSVDYNLKIINENLDLFKDLMQHKRSNLLEIIIILLILVEIINMFFEKLL